MGMDVRPGRRGGAAAILYWVFLIWAGLGLAGCAAPGRLPAVPEDQQARAQVPGMPDIRFSAQDVESLAAEAGEAFRREQACLASSGHTGPLPPTAYLAVSGGGDNGAFGAGLLNGWTAHGDRPTFKVVTGISTGALIAPFAFLGPGYDSTLREFYTTISADDIMKPRSVPAGLLSDALADNAPLRALIRNLVTPELLEEIAAEYDKGRLLLVGTTNLDTRRGVIWNMTRIAASHHPRARQLFCDVLTASAALPAAFPPVLFDVEVEGRHYQELHVDGGVIAQVFVYPPALNVRELAQTGGVQRERKLYIIRNGVIEPDCAQVECRTLPIASRAIASLIATQARGDLYTMYLITQRDGVDYNLAYIPPSFDEPHPAEFDTRYMQRLFETGYEMAVHGYPWQKQPPDYVGAQR
jgi:predicted acylesterase/phospholipase RssA